MRTAWTPHTLSASPVAGEAFASGLAGRFPVTINQFPAVILNAALQPFAGRPVAAYIVAWRRDVAPT
jgi:hypothetical protein